MGTDDWGPTIERDQWGLPRDRDAENLAMVRTGLRNPWYDGVKMECFNRAEAEYLHRRLTPEERKRVALSWLCWVPGDDAPLT